jgi:hypothetical protein
VPLLQLCSGYSLNGTVFVMGGYIGYFVLGIYVQGLSMPKKVMYGFLGLGFALTVASTWVMNFPLHPAGNAYFFFDYLTVNVIISSVALFMFLSQAKADWPGERWLRFRRIVKAIIVNTLPIFLLHVIIMETLLRGYLGFKLNLAAINHVIEIPLVTMLVLFISLALVLVMKKIPVLKRLIG